MEYQVDNSLEWEWKKHPVIRIDLNAGNYAKNGVEILKAVISRQLRVEAEKQGVILEDDDCANRFASLIQKACDKTGERVAVIFSEKQLKVYGR